MAVAYIMDFSATSADYDWVIERMGLVGDRLPAGALFHAAGATQDGWRVCDVWETAEQFDTFAEEQIRPLTAQRGMAPAAMESFEAHQVRRGTEPAPAGFAHVVRIPGLDAEGFAALDTAVLGQRRVLPKDCIFHVNGPLGDGWCVLDYWTTRAARDAFVASKVRPAVEAMGASRPPTFEELDVHNSMYVATQARARA